MKFAKRIVTVGTLAAIAIFGLSACSRQATEAEIDASQHKIIEVDSGVLSFTWEYEDADGNREKMSECEQTAIFEDPCVETADGRVQFRYTMVKGAVWYPHITYDSVEHETDCILPGSVWEDRPYLCGALS